MANPNIVNVTEIYGKTAVANLSTTDATLVVENTAESNAVLKINSIIVSNTNSQENVSVTVNLYSEANVSGTATQICSTVVIPFNASLVVIDKSTGLYLEENRSLGAIANTAASLKVVCSYEVIS